MNNNENTTTTTSTDVPVAKLINKVPPAEKNKDDLPQVSIIAVPHDNPDKVQHIGTIPQASLLVYQQAVRDRALENLDYDILANKSLRKDPRTTRARPVRVVRFNREKWNEARSAGKLGMKANDPEWIGIGRDTIFPSIAEAARIIGVSRVNLNCRFNDIRKGTEEYVMIHNRGIALTYADLNVHF